MRLGKKTEQLYGHAEKLHKQLDRYASGPPQIRFTDNDVDQARAAGVLIAHAGRSSSTARCTASWSRPRSSAPTTSSTRRLSRREGEDERRSAKEPADPVTVAKRERDAQLRELTDQAHGANYT